jgi:DNA replication and repair protein RecF
MVLSYLSLKNFRRHLNTQLNFSPGLNYIVGGNGQGKTSVLEAIYYLCTTRSFDSPDVSVLSFGEKEFEINGVFSGQVEDRVKIVFAGEANKKYYILNGKNISRPADVIGKFPAVLLAPADHSITQEGPAERRRFVDSVLSQASETYLRSLLDYNKTLRQRGALLVKIREARRTDYLEELDAWNISLVSLGSAIIKRRIEFIKEFKHFISVSYERIMHNREIPEIKYFFLEGFEGEDIESRFKDLLIGKKEEEIRRGQNIVGPHRDEFIFETNGLNLKTFGSQGQHKTFQVVLRFAEFFYLKESSGRTPVFMLDDVFGELDAERSMKISSYLRDVGQAFITLTDFTNINFIQQNESDNLIRLREGALIN